MSMKTGKVPVELAIGVLRTWKETYRWIPVFGAFVAFAMAFSTGANGLPIPFSTLVGSGTVTFLQASLAACMINVPGTAFASNSNVDAMFSNFLKENQPNEGFLMWSVVVILVTATIWLALATYLELPVSTHQSTQGALFGTMLVTQGFNFIPIWDKTENYNVKGGCPLRIFLEWTIAPLIAFFGAFFFFGFLKFVVLRHENGEKRILFFLPVYYGLSAGLLCLFLMYQVVPHIITVENWMTVVAVILATFIGALLSLLVVVPLVRKRLDTIGKSETIKKTESVKHNSAAENVDRKTDDNDAEFEEAFKDFMKMRVLDTVYEEDERSCESPPEPDSSHVPTSSTSHTVSAQSTPFKQLLECSPNWVIQTRSFQKIGRTTSRENLPKFLSFLKNSTFFPEYDRHTLVRHALAEKFDEMEDFLGFPQLLASCILALIQSATEIVAFASPYGAILDIYRHRANYSGNSKDLASIHVTWWIKAIGGFGASMGFLLCGWRLTRCLGGKVTYVSNSRGLASQFCAVAAIIMVTKMRLPVSISHAFIGSLLGVGVADDPWNVNWKLLLKFLCGWVLTLLFCCTVAYGLYSFTIYSPSYVVP